jgi:glycosyltransferase involved in cell wall biosynthesis
VITVDRSRVDARAKRYITGGPTRPVYVNGRFRGQAVTGVQRYAIELTQALDLCWPAGRQPPTLLEPTGRLRGQAWEQLGLPMAARGGLLVSLGNLGPVAMRCQILLIHDAGVFVTPDSYARPFRMLYKSLQYLLARRGVRIVAQSRFTRDEISRTLGLPSAAIAVIGAGADHALHVAADPTMLPRNNLSPGRFVLAVGSLAPHKNLAALGETATRLREAGLELVITGGINSRVFGDVRDLPQPALYLGRVNDAELRALYEGAACFVFPSRYEGLGFPALEAMQCGCPVVASAAGALPEVCGDAATLVDPSSPAAIADAVCALVATPELQQRGRQKGLARASEFTWKGTALRLLEVIREEEKKQFLFEKEPKNVSHTRPSLY